MPEMLDTQEYEKEKPVDIRFSSKVEYINEAIKKWDYRLLDIKTKSARDFIAIILENQMKWYESTNYVKHEILDILIKNGIFDLIIDVFHTKDFIPYELVSIEAMTGPVELISLCDPSEFIEDTITISAVSRKLPYYEMENLNLKNIFNDLKNWIIKDVIKDLKNNCKFTIRESNVDKAIDILNEKISIATNGKNATWIVVNPSMKLTRDDYKIFYDESISSNEILMGYKGEEHWKSGYVYAFYVPISGVLPIADNKFGLMTRYGKHLSRSDFYGKIIIEN